MVWLILNFIEQLIVSLFQQLIKFQRQVMLAEAASVASMQKRVSMLVITGVSAFSIRPSSYLFVERFVIMVMTVVSHALSLYSNYLDNQLA